MITPTAVDPVAEPERLQFGFALSADAIAAMAPAWTGLTRESELPTSQPTWVLSGVSLMRGLVQPFVGYVTDGRTLRGVLPLMTTRVHGLEHLCQIGAGLPIITDIPHTDAATLDLLLRSVLKHGSPVLLSAVLESSPAVALIRTLTERRKVYSIIEPGPSMARLNVAEISQQDRSQSAARISILATSYGFSGGPHDVLFQYASPTAEQGMSLFHELSQLEGKEPTPGDQAARQVVGELRSVDFLRAFVGKAVQGGEIRFACLRLAGRLLAAQLFVVRGKTAWLLKADRLARFQGTVINSLLFGQTVAKLQADGVEHVVMSSLQMARETGRFKEIGTVDVQVFPWSTRSLTALMLRRAGASWHRLRHRHV